MIIFREMDWDKLVDLKELHRNYVECGYSDEYGFCVYMLNVLDAFYRDENDLELEYGSMRDVRKVYDMCLKIAKAHGEI